MKLKPSNSIFFRPYRNWDFCKFIHIHSYFFSSSIHIFPTRIEAIEFEHPLCVIRRGVRDSHSVKYTAEGLFQRELSSLFRHRSFMLEVNQRGERIGIVESHTFVNGGRIDSFVGYLTCIIFSFFTYTTTAKTPTNLMRVKRWNMIHS